MVWGGFGARNVQKDPELAGPVYHVATERGERSVADSYLEKRPAEKRRGEEYVAARQEASSLGRMFAEASQPPPHALSNGG